MTPAERGLFDIRGRSALHHCVPIGFAPDGKWQQLQSGTVTLLKFGKRQFGVTNHHVVACMEEVIAAGESLYCQIGRTKIDPIARLVARSRTLDMAVLDLDDILDTTITTAAKLKTAFHQPVSWPPDPVSQNDLLMIGGFPGALRQLVDGRNFFSFRSLSATGIRVETVNEYRIGCRIEKELSIVETDVPGEAVPALGGMSGGLVMIERPNIAGLHLFEPVAIIQEYVEDYDMIYLSPLANLNTDGTIQLPPSDLFG